MQYDIREVCKQFAVIYKDQWGNEFPVMMFSDKNEAKAFIGEKTNKEFRIMRTFRIVLIILAIPLLIPMVILGALWGEVTGENTVEKILRAIK